MTNQQVHAAYELLRATVNLALSDPDKLEAYRPILLQCVRSIDIAFTVQHEDDRQN